jgi:hypothetical protein
MQKFSTHLVLGILVILALDFLVGSALNYFYFNQSSGFQYRTTYALEETNAEVLVFGSSRANHHYDPEVFQNSLKKPFYNTGRDGQFIFYQTALLEGILERYTPEIIIYDFAGSFEYDQEDYDRLSSLMPYYDSNENIREVVNLRSAYEPVKNLSKVYPFNSSLFNIMVGNMEFNKTKNKDFQGYVPLEGNWKIELDSIVGIKKYKTDSVKVAQFKKFIALVKAKNIRLYICYSPVYVFSEHDYSKTLCEKICADEKIPFYDFSRKQDYLSNKEFFSDQIHLNAKGAIIFSRQLSNMIINDINE